MAKFSFEEGGEGSGVRKRRRIVAAGETDPTRAEKRFEESEVEDDEGEEAIEEEEEEEEEGAIATENGDGIRVRVDPDLLDCSICFEPLRPPLYQCQNGHVACSSCWSQLCNKCHICSREVSRSRNVFLEKIIESIKVSCSYAKWGCPENISYAKRPAHEEKCIFAPSECPFPGCSYKGFNRCWSGHFVSSHKLFPKKFKYDHLFKMSLPTTEQFVYLLGPDGQLFLLLNKNVEPAGYALSIVCIRGGVMKCKFSYELAVTASNGSSLQLKASVMDIREWNGIYPTDAFLLVPSEFAPSASEIEVDVSVCKL
ncbi:E3 ubiquitin-protein ligase SINA-like 10 [Ananas comosus]|uniref:RING-type E3 ubiquitin transferase n=1 Tax=Ananas comosus TaxID=4615 RepID=A0A199VKG8_ANACO|nr:E3 ubiquitin-protein ligase SINA-like 10 [Ananas comosus]